MLIFFIIVFFPHHAFSEQSLCQSFPWIDGVGDDERESTGLFRYEADAHYVAAELKIFSHVIEAFQKRVRLQLVVAMWQQSMYAVAINA